MKTNFHTTPDTHAAENGHWDHVTALGPNPSGELNDLKVRYLDIQFQNGPVSENGHNGVQLPDVLRICLARYQMLNKSFRCRENSIVITKLQEAIMWDEERTAKRTQQGVEGQDLAHKS